jgi:hypothetical protein
MEDLFDYYKDREENTISLATESTDLQKTIDNLEEDENPSEVSWSNLITNEDRCKLLTGFSPNEFLTIYDIVSDNIEQNIGRGPRSKISKHDKLVMVLCYLKHYETIDKMKDTFSISRSHLHNILMTTINSISPVLYDYYVENLNERIEDEDNEILYPNAKYVIDVTFQSIWTPTGTYDEKKQFFSGKHKLYGLKSQCIHDRKGRVVHTVAGERGAMHDLTICRENIDDLKIILNNEEDNNWFVIADLAYKGLDDTVDVLLPHKKKPNKQLTKAQTKYNKELGAQRVICERYYGRLKIRYRIIASKYRNSRDEYPTIFNLCIALTNYNIILHPL